MPSRPAPSALLAAFAATLSLLPAARPALAGLPATPVEQWRWEGDVRDPMHPTVHGSPIVVQLDDDDGDGLVGPGDLPEVVFIAQGDFGGASVVKVLDGRDGTTIRTFPDARLDTSLLGAADLDGDGVTELIAAASTEFLAFRADGSLFRSIPTPMRAFVRDPLAVADLDGDGVPDLYSSAVVSSSDGAWGWRGGAGQGQAQVLYGSLATDWLPASPGLELIAGRTVYSAAGAVLLDAPALPDGLNAVADLDGDGVPEIVLASSINGPPLRAELRLLDPSLGLLAGPVLLEEGAGAYVSGPVVADLDADGLGEVVVPTTSWVTALEWDGTNLSVKWRTPTETIFSATGATAFDFDGDGAAEVVYRDEYDWMILEGFDGSVLHREPFPSGTLFEMPVVANIDDDPHAEILVPSLGPTPGPQGDLVAYEVPGSCTPRSLWNQQTYHVGNIGDDASVPVAEERSWTTHGTWQAQVGTCCGVSISAPLEDLVACEGEEVLLDASGIELTGCSGTVEREWSDGAGVLGSGATLRFTPDETVVVTLSVTCDSDSGCGTVESALVEVRHRPLLEPATATDPSDCGLGLRLDWSPAGFPDGGGGSYHVYRSEGPSASCADALSRPPVARDLAGTTWTDGDTRDGETYVYVVEAESAESPSPCSPTGPNGGAATRSCLAPVVEAGQYASPAGVGAVLRGSHDGDAVRFEWPGARALLPGEHFHLLKAPDSPGGPFTRANPEADLGGSHEETDLSSLLQFFDLRVANGCEELSPDEFPPTGG